MKYFLILALISTTAFAQEQKCKPLEKLMAQIHSKKRYNFSSVNKLILMADQTKCDDGEYAENISDIVMQSLVKDFVRTIKTASKNKKSEAFVLGHIPGSADDSEIKKVSENANTICPKNKKDFCQQIVKGIDKSKM